MSGIRLVRCPKCNRVLPEPPQYAVYQCGAVLRAKRSTLSDGLSKSSENLVNSETERESEEFAGGSRVESSDQEGTFHKGSRSPARSTIGVDIGVKPSLMESDLTEFDGSFPKSPMRDRFLNDVGSVPSARTRSRDVSMSPLRDRGSVGFDYEGAGKSPARLSDYGKSPIRETKTPDKPMIDDDYAVNSPLMDSDLTEFDGSFPKSPMRDRFLSDLGSASNSPMRSTDVSRSPVRQRQVSQSPIRESRTPMSVRSRNVSRSPMREIRNATGLDGVNKSPSRSMAGDFPNSPAGNSPEFHEKAQVLQEESGVGRDRKLTVKSSFNEWLTDDEHRGQSDDDNSGYSDRRRPWRSQEDFGFDQISKGRESIHGYEYGVASEGSINNHIHATGGRKESKYQDKFKRGDIRGYVMSRTTTDQSAIKMDGFGLIHGNSKAVVEHGRTSASSSSNAERGSSYRPNSTGTYREPRQSFESMRRPASVQDLEMERAQLLRRYKELGGQLGELDDNSISSSGLYSGSDDYSEDGFGRFRARSGQQFMPGRGMRRPVHANHSSSPVHNMANVYDIHHTPYDYPLSGQMTRGPCFREAHQFSNYISGSVGGRFDQEFPESYLDETHQHHPSCPCSHCYVDDDWQHQGPHYSIAGRRSANLVRNPWSSHSVNVERYGPRPYDPRMARTTPLGQPSHLTHHHPRRGQKANLNKRLCLPIAGAAPFILCRNCFRLLKLPSKFMVKQKNQYRIQCGGCSVVMSFNVQSKSFSLFSAEKDHDSFDADSGLVKGLKDSNLDDHRDSCDATSTNLESCDFDGVGNSFQSVDSEGNEESKKQISSESLSGNMQKLSPSSSHSSKEDRFSDNASAKSSLPNSTEMPSKSKIELVPPPSGSPLRDLLDYSTYFRKIQAGEVTDYSREDKLETETDVSIESPMENATAATEVDVNSQEVPPTTFSQDSEELTRQEHIGSKRDGPSSKTDSTSPGRGEVYVNGRLIPQHLVKKAEKYAGPIEPGEYWYDSKAGFWGLMAHRCLGIIPPFIREFRFPMPANCSGGNTTIFVNGRELHRKDLDVLKGRQLPDTMNKRYIIDISGRVVDEESNQFVVNLGKLAPTVERKRLGFGMQVPEILDDE